jgi:hypothetical protein
VAHLEEPFTTIALVCVCFGLRISECLALKWSDIDWLCGKLRVERAIVRQRVDDTKTIYSKRRMHLDAELLAVLKRWKQVTDFSSEAIGFSPVLQNSDGCRGPTPRVWQVFQEAASAGGIGKLGTHTMRHTYRSWGLNRLHSILHHCLIPLPQFDLFSKAGRTWLRELALPESEAAARDSDLRLLESTEEEIAKLEQNLVRDAWKDKRVRLLMSIPGVDYTVAQTCLAAIGDVARFANAKKLTSYLGLNPSTRQSANHCVHGPITKQGNAHARWLLVQAAQHMAVYRGPLGQTMRNIIKRKN